MALKINTCPNESGSGSFLGNVGLFIISSFYTIKHQNRHQYHLLSRQNLILMEAFMNNYNYLNQKKGIELTYNCNYNYNIKPKFFFEKASFLD